MTRAKLTSWQDVTRSALVIGALAAGAGSAGSACKTPTEVTLAIETDVAHRADMSVAVQLGALDDIETAPPRVVTRSGWDASGSVGTVVVVPRGDGASVVARVVLATGRDPSLCTATDATGCIVARRRIRFTPGEATRLRLPLRAACLGAFCDGTSSCAADGTCGSLEDDVGSGSDDGGAAPIVVDGGDPYVNAVLEDRPRHYYRLGEPLDSTVAHDTTGRANGTFDRVKLGVTGALRTSTDTAAFFDGASSVTVPGVEDLPGAYSIEVWARSDATDATDSTILARVDEIGGATFGYRMSKPPATTASFEVYRGEQTFAANARATKFAGFSHLVAVVRGEALEIWRDGTQDASTKLTAASSSSAVVGPFVIGRSRDRGGAFKGAIDEVAVYDYPLDRVQILRHYAAAGTDL